MLEPYSYSPERPRPFSPHLYVESLHGYCTKPEISGSGLDRTTLLTLLYVVTLVLGVLPNPPTH